MTSVTVKNADLDAGLLPVNTKTVKVKAPETGKDFGTILSQTRDKSVQTNQQSEEMHAKPDTGTNTMQNRTKQEVTDVDTEVSAETQTDDMQDVDTQNVQDAEEDGNITAEPEQGMSVEEEPVTEEIAETVNDAVQKLMQTIQEELDVSEEDLEAAMEQLGLQPADLLQMQNLAELIAEVSGAESVIEVVADPDMYQQLQNLTEAVGETLEKVTEETGLSQDELEAVLEKLKNMGENSIDSQLTMQEPVSEDDNEVPVMQQDISEQMPAVEIMTEQKAVSVIKEDEDAQVQLQVNDAEDVSIQEEIPEVEEIATENEDWKKQSDNSKQDEQTSYQQGENHFNKFQNTLDETTAVTAEAEPMPTRTIDTESIMRQLADYVKIHNGKELTEMEMQLHPASLGNVHIQLATKGGVVTAQITTQNETVKNAIESQVVQLRNNLEEQGVKVEAVEVSVASHEMERNLDQNGKEQQDREQDNATGSIRRIRRTNINLNFFNSEEEMLAEAGGLEDAARIAMEMMAANGNTMDLLA